MGRAAHRETLQGHYENGVLVMSGPFAGDSRGYTHDDVVTRASIREWAPILGPAG